MVVFSAAGKIEACHGVVKGTPWGAVEPCRGPVRIPLVRTSSESTVRRPGKTAETIVPSPSPGRHAATRSRRGSSSSSPPTADGFGTGTPVPSPQSQSFSRGYGSILPTSLAYIVPSTRGCSPWRPDAVMSTTGRGWHSVLRIFKGRRGRTGHHAKCGALPAAGPYLRLSRFQGGQAICTDGRSARAHAPGFAATAAPSYSSGPGTCPDGRVCSHSNPSQKIKVGRRCNPLGDPANQLPCALRADTRSTQMPKHAVRRVLPTTIAATTSPRAYYSPGLGRRRNPHRSTPESIGRRLITVPSDRGASPAPIRFPPDNFKHSLTLFSKSFSSFPRGTCLLSVSRPYLALDGIYRPIGAAFPNNPTRRQRLVVRQGPGTTGLSPSPAPPSRGLGPGPPLRTLLQTTIRTPNGARFSSWAFPVPPDLGSRWKCRLHDTAGSQSAHRETRHARRETRALSTTDCRGARRRGLVFRLTARTSSREANVRPDSPRNPSCEVFGVGATMRDTQTCLGQTALGATCVQKLDDSRDSAIHTKYRISLRSSSMREPRYPLPRVVLYNSQDVPTDTVSGAFGGTLLLKFLGAVRAGVRCSVGGTRACGSLSAPEGRQDNSTCSPTVLGTGGF
ncbi:Protein TAR1 [Morella rubra]|uniref:Protein TAR1 n=1 Tax=Morella rubra TaxID=262757 RepID=A0A6A1VQ68_9ROSI|nr:Protein TAR1 [Morella rubra]